MGDPGQNNVAAVDLSNCDREPIHIPGSIQAHGALLAFEQNGNLALSSVNAATILGPLPAIGTPLSDGHLTPFLRRAISDANLIDDPLDDLFGVTLDTKKFDVIFSLSEGLLLVEFEQYRNDQAVTLDNFPTLTQRAIDRVQRQTTTAALLEVVVAEVHALTGFDRVMAYRFLPDDSGEVVTERRRDDLEPLVNMRYPSSDIPAQARRLYVLNPLRIIVDVGSKPVPLSPAINPTNGKPLDLSHSVLRSVSPVHLEYLSNMGVAASMSISIVVNNTLWGLIACHNMSPCLVPRNVRMSCQLLSQIVSVLVERTLSQERVKAIEHSLATRRRISDRLAHPGDLLHMLVNEHPTFIDLIDCNGGAAAIDGHAQVSGKAPSAEVVLDLIDWLEARNTPDIYATDSVSRDLPELKNGDMHVSGFLAARFHRERSGYVFWFRDEQIEHVRWGGNPTKTYSVGPLGPRLTPRGSFAEWKEEVKNKSTAWLVSEVEIATQFRSELQDIALAKSTLSERARDTLFATLGHDLRDPLQAIMMAAQLLERQDSESAKSTLGKRITSSSVRMKRLISEVLDVSRIQNGLGLNITPVPTDVTAILNDLSRETMIAHPDSEIVSDWTAAGHANVDPDRLSQIVSNLLSNARHHGESGKPIFIHAGGDIETLRISVTNFAPPIDPKIIPTLFDPFKPSRRNNRKNPNGLGLGLYIVNEIVKGHGGTIDVQCNDGKVSFHIMLPR